MNSYSGRIAYIIKLFTDIRLANPTSREHPLSLLNNILFLFFQYIDLPFPLSLLDDSTLLEIIAQFLVIDCQIGTFGDIGKSWLLFGVFLVSSSTLLLLVVGFGEDVS